MCKFVLVVPFVSTNLLSTLKQNHRARECVFTNKKRPNCLHLQFRAN